ncbi:demethylmenaquinone methyltransferase [Bacteroidia bacterium]|nr:demethylmenaquinone methyltransferase [Bacteroidia bacterium]
MPAMLDNVAHTSKKEQVKALFNHIAPHYDWLNHLLSLRVDVLWRKKLVRLALQHRPQNVLDAATGTADVAIALARGNACKVIGVDISAGMLQLALQKVQRAKLQNCIRLQQADGEHLPFADNTFDAATIAFGIRNYENRRAGLQEFLRVLRPQGSLLVLEFSLPQNRAVAALYEFYFYRILPVIGKIISKNQSAYTYLPQSVQAFPTPKDFSLELQSIGFGQVTSTKLSLGIAHIYEATK